VKPQGTSVGSLLRAVLRLMAAATFADLGLLLVVLIAHASTGSDFLLKPSLFLTVALALLSAAALVIGAAYAWAVYPQHRRALVFVVVVTGLTLLAHIYVVNVPAATQGGVLSGAVGTTLQDQQIRVNSSLLGSVLAVSVHVSGGNPVADLQVSADGVPLQGSWSGQAPTLSSPLSAEASVSGAWSVGSPPSQVSVSYQTLICYDQSTGVYGCIMDEVFYVPEAQGILTGQHCSTSAPNCHMEHPPLSPALEAAGMALFGEYNAAGWRALPVLLGTFSLPLLFGIAWRLSGDKKVGYFSMALLGLDVMFFSHSGAALLDVPMVFFGLLALFVLVWDIRFWKVDKYILSGVMLALAGLSKETAIFLAFGLFTYNFVLGEGSRRRRLLTTLKMAVVLAIVFSAGLQTYDSLLATPAVPTFLDQMKYMLSYGSSLIANQLACQPTTGYWCKFLNNPGGAPILPTDWLLYYTPVGYYATSVTVCPNTVNGVCQGGQYSYVSVAYYGVTNLLETWTTWVWAPLVAFLLYRRFYRQPSGLDRFVTGEGDHEEVQISQELRFASVVLIWFLWTYVPYLFLLLGGRVTYPFYFVPAIPSVAMGVAFLLTRKWFPRWAALVFVAAAFVFFFVYFPYKGFLPDWARVAIGR
jgi:hypothetical protein